MGRICKGAGTKEGLCDRSSLRRGDDDKVGVVGFRAGRGRCCEGPSCFLKGQTTLRYPDNFPETHIGRSREANSRAFATRLRGQARRGGEKGVKGRERAERTERAERAGRAERCGPARNDAERRGTKRNEAETERRGQGPACATRPVHLCEAPAGPLRRPRKSLRPRDACACVPGCWDRSGAAAGQNFVRKHCCRMRVCDGRTPT